MIFRKKMTAPVFILMALILSVATSVFLLTPVYAYEQDAETISVMSGEGEALSAGNEGSEQAVEMIPALGEDEGTPPARNEDPEQAEDAQQAESAQPDENTEETQGAKKDEPAAPVATLNATDHIVYMQGYGDESFGPNNYLTRAEIAVILLRLLSEPVTPTVFFSDVPVDAWYAEAANTMGTLGIVRTETFLPDEAISRAEFVRWLSSFFTTRTDAEQFPDVSDDSPDAPYILNARAWGWVEGSDDGAFHPDDPLTRAEAVTIINRALNRSPDQAYINDVQPVFYWDVAPGRWYYNNIMEASTAHTYSSDGGAEQWTSCTVVPAELPDGLLHKDGWLYYFDSAKNDIVRNASVGNFDFDANGHFTSGNTQLDGLLYDIYVTHTNGGMTVREEQRLRALYNYTRDSFKYLRRSPYPFGVLDFMEEDALRILTTGYGNCYCYASLFWYLARWEGYDARIFNGTVGSSRSPHSWVEITFDGTSYIFDTELEMSYRLKGQYINMYKWLGYGWHYRK